MLDHRAFDITEFDAVTTYFDLMITATLAFDLAVRSEAGQVTSAIHQSIMACGEGIADECRRGQLGAMQIATGDSVASDHQLTSGSNRHWLKLRIDDIDRGVGDRGTDRDAVGRRFDFAAGRPNGRLRWAVHIP